MWASKRWLRCAAGRRIDNIRPGEKRQKALRRAARALSRCKRGSNRRKKLRAKLARVQQGIRNARSTYLHQVSAQIVREHDFISVEDLNLKNMTRSSRGTCEKPGTNVAAKSSLNRALADAAPGRLISMISYKAERAGRIFVKVDPRNTTQACSACDAIVPKSGGDRWHSCSCGADLHRDHNAAINIRERGLAAYEAARRLGDANVGHWPERCPGSTDLLAA